MRWSCTQSHVVSEVCIRHNGLQTRVVQNRSLVRRLHRLRHGFVVHAGPLRPDETPEQAYERRMKESSQVEQRVSYVHTVDEFNRWLDSAGEKLVVLEVGSDTVCQTGLAEEAELQWREDQLQALEPCRAIKDVLQRTARECPDVLFLRVLADDPEASELVAAVNVTVLPTLQFWKHGTLLWEKKGVLELDQNLGEGVLYFQGSAAAGVKASDYITEIRSRQDYYNFVHNQPRDTLNVIDVSLTSASPCVRIFPAVLALARSFQGLATFARLVGDANRETQVLMDELNILEVPTFIFSRNGVEVDRHVGSSRGDLIGHILDIQARFGIAPPPPPKLQRKAQYVQQQQQRRKVNPWGSSA